MANYSDDDAIECGGLHEADDAETWQTKCVADHGESRYVLIGEKTDDRLFARVVTEGPDTDDVWHCDERAVTVVFAPSEGYGRADLERLMEGMSDPDDVYITDFIDSLQAFGVRYELREWTMSR